MLATMSMLLIVASVFAAGDVSPRPQLPLALATACVAVALATVAHRNGERAPGAWGVPGGVIAVLFVGALAFKFPGWLPTLTAGPSFGHWWYVAAVAFAVAVVAGRDPGTRR